MDDIFGAENGDVTSHKNGHIQLIQLIQALHCFYGTLW